MVLSFCIGLLLVPHILRCCLPIDAPNIVRLRVSHLCSYCDYPNDLYVLMTLYDPYCLLPL